MFIFLSRNTNSKIKNLSKDEACLELFVALFTEIKNKYSRFRISFFEEIVLAAMQIISHYTSIGCDSEYGDSFRNKMEHWIKEYLGSERYSNIYCYYRYLFQLAWRNALKIRWEWNYGNIIESMSVNPVSRIMVLMLDIFVNPSCINKEWFCEPAYYHSIDEQIDYYCEAPICLREPMEYIKITNKLGKPLLACFLQYHDKIINCLLK